MCCNFYFLTWEKLLSWILNFMWGERFECQLFSFDLCCSCTVYNVTLVKCFFKAIGLYPYICNVSFTKHVFLSFVSSGGLIPLHNACSFGHAEVVRLLLRHGADPNSRDNWNYTPLHEAAVKGKVDVCVGKSSWFDIKSVMSLNLELLLCFYNRILIRVQCTSIILVAALHFHEVREFPYSGMQIKLVITQFGQNFAVCNKIFILPAVICELTACVWLHWKQIAVRRWGFIILHWNLPGLFT